MITKPTAVLQGTLATVTRNHKADVRGARKPSLHVRPETIGVRRVSHRF